ncbi:Leucine-rich repeat-containing protein 16A-like isoform X4 [Oopsacas minuta]|uniref:Leucine-rich repeat-containing protein 16A-like isoform X4 n=1 Tax=Oopsacas minuta TaxID=111878 RepID=A0AAV7JZ16_9METZ|nr:Leucine-rich repeat-containing protein 16A-like isoform X4 [Oopsacas minuta]
MLCDLYEVPVHEEVLWDIENAYFSRGRKMLSLSEFSHLPCKDLLPILAALEYNEYFIGLSLVDTKLSNEGVEVLQKVLRHNSTLTQLTLKNIGLKPESVHKLMTRSLSVNKRSSITHIDLSDNPLEDKGVIDVANALEKLSNLTNVILKRCLMTSKGSFILTNSLLKNTNVRSSLVELSIGENPLYQGNSLHGFLKYLASPNSLTKLDLTVCGIPLEFLCNALAQSSLHTLEELYFACNIKLPQGHRSHSISSPYYKHFFSSTRALRHIDMSNCKLHPDTIILILEGLRENISGVKLVLDLSSNLLTPRIQEIANLIGQITVLFSLRMYNVGLNEHYEEAITKMSSNSNLKHLYLGKNFRKGKWSAGEALQLFVINSELETLSLSECKLKEAIHFLIRSLKQNHTLKVLDITGNLMGDGGARLLAKVLHMNSTLQVLNYDQNNLSPSGLGYICSALTSNHSLRDMSFPIQDLFQIKREYEKDKYALNRAEHYLQKIEESVKRNHSQSKHSLELKSHQNKLAVKLVSIRHVVEQTAGKLKGVIDKTERSRETRPDVREANNILIQLDECIKLSETLYPDPKQQTDTREINTKFEGQIRDLISSLYRSHVTTNRLMQGDDEHTVSDLFTQQHMCMLQKDLSDLAKESESKLTEDLISNNTEVGTSSLLICNINMCLLSLDRIVPTLIHSSEQFIARLKALQNESSIVSSQETVAERITSSISSRPVSYLARTPPMPTRLTDSLNSIEDDTDSRLSLSLINPTIIEEVNPHFKSKPNHLEDLLVPIQTHCEDKPQKSPDKDSLDFNISLPSELMDFPLQTTPVTSPSIDSDRVRSALDFFDQSLQMDSNDDTEASGEIDLDTIVSSEKVKLEFLTKTRAPRPKGRRPQPRPRSKFQNEPISEDIFLEIAHTAVAGLEDKSCQMQIKPFPPSENDVKIPKLNFRKSMSADGGDASLVTVTKPRINRKDYPRPLTEPNFDSPNDKLIPIEKPQIPEQTIQKPEVIPAKPMRIASLPARPVPPLRKRPIPSPQEPSQTSAAIIKPPSKSCSSAITDKTSDEKTEKPEAMEDDSTTKSLSTPQPRERNIITPNSAMASVMINALSKVQVEKKESPPPVPPVKPPHMREVPPILSKAHLTSPLKPPTDSKPAPQRPTSPPKGVIQDLPSKPVPPPRIRRENLEKREKKDRDSSIVVID